MKLWMNMFLGAALLAMVGCSSNGTKVESDLGLKGAPDWVNEGTKVVKNEKGDLIHGIGSAPDMGDLSLQKSTADNRARAEIARVVSTIIDSTIDDYTTSNGEAFDMAIEREIKSTTQTALNGSMILGNWRDPKTNVIYSFAELDKRKLDKAIEAAQKLDVSGKLAGLKDSLNANFDRFMKAQ